MRKRKHIMKGGEITLSAVPVESYGFKYGSTPSEDALGKMNASQIEQNKFNNTLSGGKRIKRGGRGEIVIPQFSEYGSGSQVSPQNANSAAFQTNQVLITAMNDAQNDNLIGTTQTGGKSRRRRKSKTKSRKHKKRTMKKKHKKTKSKK
jgi:hypothetical protein